MGRFLLAKALGVGAVLVLVITLAVVLRRPDQPLNIGFESLADNVQLFRVTNLTDSRIENLELHVAPHANAVAVARSHPDPWIADAGWVTGRPMNLRGVRSEFKTATLDPGETGFWLVRGGGYRAGVHAVMPKEQPPMITGFERAIRRFLRMGEKQALPTGRLQVIGLPGPELQVRWLARSGNRVLIEVTNTGPRKLENVQLLASVHATPTVVQHPVVWSRQAVWLEENSEDPFSVEWEHSTPGGTLELGGRAWAILEFGPLGTEEARIFAPYGLDSTDFEAIGHRPLTDTLRRALPEVD